MENLFAKKLSYPKVEISLPYIKDVLNLGLYNNVGKRIAIYYHNKLLISSYNDLNDV